MPSRAPALKQLATGLSAASASNRKAVPHLLFGRNIAIRRTDENCQSCQYCDTGQMPDHYGLRVVESCINIQKLFIFLYIQIQSISGKIAAAAFAAAGSTTELGVAKNGLHK